MKAEVVVAENKWEYDKLDNSPLYDVFISVEGVSFASGKYVELKRDKAIEAANSIAASLGGLEVRCSDE